MKASFNIFFSETKALNYRFYDLSFFFYDSEIKYMARIKSCLPGR